MKHELRTWLNVFNWIQKNRPDVIDEALGALNQNKALTDGQKVAAFIKAYADAYKVRYGEGARPACLDDGKTRGEITRFLKNRKLEDAVNLIQVYLQMPDKWFATKFHDFTTFAQNINKIALALVSGRADPGKKSWQEIAEQHEGVKHDGEKRLRPTDPEAAEPVAALVRGGEDGEPLDSPEGT